MFGASYYFSEFLIIHTGIEKNINYPASFLAGINYQPNEKIFLNTGVGSKPNLSSFGFGIIQQNFTFLFCHSNSSIPRMESRNFSDLST